jgi:hypothetical protein
VDRLKFLDVIFGDQPALSPAELVYQRVLARDPVEAAEQAQKYLKEKPLLAYYQEVLIEGLKLAQGDGERGALDHERMMHIRDSVAELVDDLAMHEDKPDPTTQSDAKADEEAPLAQISKTEESLSRRVKELPERWRSKTPVLCVPGSGLLDEAVALVVAQLVSRQGIGARAEQADALSMSRIFSLDTKDVALVCLCYVENATSAQIRYAVRRLRRKVPDAFILVTMVGQASNIADEEILQCSTNIDFVKQSLSDTVDRIFAIATSPSQTQDVEQPELIAAQ